MASRSELLRAEIEKTKRDLAGHLSGLKVEAQATKRKAIARTGLAAGILVAGMITFKLARFLMRHRSD